MTGETDTIREGEAPAEPSLRLAQGAARQEPRPPSVATRAVWIVVEAVLVLLILGLIVATVLPAIVGRSANADRFDFQRSSRNRTPSTSR